MKQNVYVLIKDNEVTCHSNLTKLIRNTLNLSYFKVYRALGKSNDTIVEGHRVIKCRLK